MIVEPYKCRIRLYCRLALLRRVIQLLWLQRCHLPNKCCLLFFVYCFVDPEKIDKQAIIITSVVSGAVAILALLLFLLLK
jgi:hypothetical protein